METLERRILFGAWKLNDETGELVPVQLEHYREHTDQVITKRIAEFMKQIEQEKRDAFPGNHI